MSTVHYGEGPPSVRANLRVEEVNLYLAREVDPLIEDAVLQMSLVLPDDVKRQLVEHFKGVQVRGLGGASRAERGEGLPGWGGNGRTDPWLGLR